MFWRQGSPDGRLEAATQLFVAEYGAVRAEAVQSFQNAQSIIQWSLAAYGVLFGAGFVALSNQEVRDDEFVQLAVLILFGVLLPGLTSAATWQWLGEITRMERTGVYLRGIENHLADTGLVLPGAGMKRPLNWETFLIGIQDKPRKRSTPYIGVAVMFGGAFCSSILLALIWQIELYGDFFFVLPNLGWIIWYMILLVVFFTVCLSLGLGVIRLGKSSYDPATNQVEKFH